MTIYNATVYRSKLPYGKTTLPFSEVFNYIFMKNCSILET